MTAYSAAKLLFGDYRRAETYVRDPKETRGGFGEIRFFGFKVMERYKIERNTLCFGGSWRFFHHWSLGHWLIGFTRFFVVVQIWAVWDKFGT